MEAGQLGVGAVWLSSRAHCSGAALAGWLDPTQGHLVPDRGCHTIITLGTWLELVCARGPRYTGMTLAGQLRLLDPIPTYAINVKGGNIKKKIALIGAFNFLGRVLSVSHLGHCRVSSKWISFIYSLFTL